MFNLTDFLGPDCESLSLDSKEDRDRINKLFYERMLKAKRGMESLQHSGCISDEELVVLFSLMEFLEEFSYKFHLAELHAWTLANYNSLNNMKTARKESESYWYSSYEESDKHYVY